MDPEAWYPEKGQSSSQAKQLCTGCEFVRPCLAWALENDEWGVWGGTTRDQRRDLRQQFGIAKRPAPHVNQAMSENSRHHHVDDAEPSEVAL